MTDEHSSMFDATLPDPSPRRSVSTVERRASSLGYELRDFLSRNGVPYDWVEIDDADRVRQLLGADVVDPNQLPICVLPDGRRLAGATVEQVAGGLGMVAAPLLAEYDITIIGAGPAGLAAAVYAASEGLRTVAFEAVAPGGQAGTTSTIENYLQLSAKTSAPAKLTTHCHRASTSLRRRAALGSAARRRKRTTALDIRARYNRMGRRFTPAFSDFAASSGVD